jgi:arsenate reductase-like glutaredoxin family protein
LFKKVNMVYVSKGKKAKKINLKNEKIDREIMEYFVLGRTGNLRAPTVLTGKKLLVGFNEEFYNEVLLSK